MRARVDLPDVADPRHVLDEASVAVLHRSQLPLHTTSLADLERHQLVRFSELVGPLRDAELEVLLVEEQHLAGVVLGGDVDHHAVPRGRSAVATADQRGTVVDPDDPAVAGDKAVLDVPGLAALAVAVVMLQDDLAVVGVQQLDPDVRLIEPFRACVAEHLFDVGADVQRLPFVVRTHLVDDRGDPFDEGPVLRLRGADVFP